MPIASKYFGTLPDGVGRLLDFPAGVPAFESETAFVLLTAAVTAPIVFLQSAHTPDLCFLAIPVERVLPGYALALSAEDRALAGFAPDHAPDARDIEVLAILSSADKQITANLLAPIVINTEQGRAVQAVRSDRVYSHAYAIRLEGIEVSACW